jgi:hypothetical protein
MIKYDNFTHTPRPLKPTAMFSSLEASLGSFLNFAAIERPSPILIHRGHARIAHDLCNKWLLAPYDRFLDKWKAQHKHDRSATNGAVARLYTLVRLQAVADTSLDGIGCERICCVAAAWTEWCLTSSPSAYNCPRLSRSHDRQRALRARQIPESVNLDFHMTSFSLQHTIGTVAKLLTSSPLTGLACDEAP